MIQAVTVSSDKYTEDRVNKAGQTAFTCVGSVFSLNTALTLAEIIQLEGVQICRQLASQEKDPS